MKILITSGATREPIDEVRFITNLSSGYTGKTMAEVLTSLGHEVVFLHGEDALRPLAPARPVMFSSFASLNSELENILGRESFDAVIHAAAVSDFSVDAVVTHGETRKAPITGKLASEAPIDIRLRPNFKIIDRLRSYIKGGATAPTQVVAFKLTNASSKEHWREAVAKLNDQAQIDYVVHNDLSERLSKDEHRFYISRKNEAVGEAGSAQDLARLLEKLLRRKS